MGNLEIILLVAALLAGGIAFWAVRTRAKALGAQRALYESAVDELADANAEAVGEREASLKVLQEQFDQTNREHAALKTLYRTTQADADGLRRWLGDRDAEVADLKGKMARDWRGEVKIRCIRHRGKGGTVPVCEEKRPVEGPSTTFRIQSEHPSGDIYDFGFELHLGLDDGHSK